MAGSTGPHVKGVLQFNEVVGSTGLNVRVMLELSKVGDSSGLNTLRLVAALVSI